MDQKRKQIGKDKFVLYPFRSLDNYIKMHKKRADKMGVLKEFLMAPTLTQARKIVFP